MVIKTTFYQPYSVVIKLANTLFYNDDNYSPKKSLKLLPYQGSGNCCKPFTGLGIRAENFI